MPSYDFQCKECGYVQEMVMSIAEYKRNHEDVPCWSCGAPSVRLWRPPNIQTDGTLMNGVGTLLEQCNGDEKEAKRIANAVKANGGSIGINDWWNPSLAQYSGDPAGVVPHDAPKSHIKKVCKERNHGCQGMVEVADPEREPVPRVPLHKRLVAESVRNEIRQDPSLKRKPKGELVNKVTEKHSHPAVEMD